MHKTFQEGEIEYLINKINEFETDSKNENTAVLYIGINQFQKGYHPKINSVNDESGYQLGDSNNILNT
jgi:hypothetical protein